MKYPSQRTKRSATKSAKLKSPESVNAVVKSICDIMRRSNCAGALQYVPELTWILFLRILDERESHEADEAAALGLSFVPSLKAPYRWRDWAAPDSLRRVNKDPSASVWTFVHSELLPYLKGLKNARNATPRQKVISEIMAGVDRSRVDSEKNFCDILDKVHQISAETVDHTHVFTLSQVYEGLLLKMGEKGNDGGQFFTPREVIRVMVRVVDPKRKLLEECDVYCIVSLPGGVFTSAGAGVKTNLVFFTKGRQTEKIWYYDLSDIKVGKKTPFTQSHFDDFFVQFPTRANGPRSWIVDFLDVQQRALEKAKPYREKATALLTEAEAVEAALLEKKDVKKPNRSEIAALEAKWKTLLREARDTQSEAQTIEDSVYDLKAVNPNRVTETDNRTPAELLEVITAQGREADAALSRLQALLCK